MAKTGPKPDGLENMRGTKPTHFPVSSKRDELIGSTSNLRRIEGGRFVLPNIIAPTEILAKAEREVENIRVQLENIFTNTVVDDPTNVAGTVRTPDALPSGVKELMEKLDHYQRIIGQMGGNVREKIMRVYEEFDFDHYWFKEAFGEADRDIIRDQLRHVSHEVGVPIGQLRVLDVGTGGEGRIVKILLDIVEELDPDNLDNFKKRIRGFDLVPKVVKNAKSALGSLGIPERNIFEGDFLDLPDKFKREKFHLVTAMMHTPWHCVTEEEWTKFMQNMEQTMAPGGRLLFDTVHIIDPHDTPDREKTFADFHSFYTILWRRYCDKMQPVVNQVVGPYMNEGHEVPLLRKLSRHFVQDHTAGIEDASFVREIPTQAFLERICEDNDINLRMAVSTTVYNQNSGDAELMEALGKRWIRQNNLERYVFYKIAERLHRLTGQLPTFDQINEIFKDIRYQMTRKYSNEYRSFKKDKTA